MLSFGAGIGMLGGGAALDGINFDYKDVNCSWAVLFWVLTPIVTAIVVLFMITVRDPKGVKDSENRPVDVLGESNK